VPRPAAPVRMAGSVPVPKPRPDAESTARTVLLDAADQQPLARLVGHTFPPRGTRVRLPDGREGTVAGHSLVLAAAPSATVLVWVDLDRH
jgi:hypothetical protein